VFAVGRRTQILLLTNHEIPIYQKYYGTERERFHVLPPGIVRRVDTDADRIKARRRLRADHGWKEDEHLLLLVGSGFRVKGVDRAIDALSGLPASLREQTRLIVIGQNRSGEFMQQARRLGVAGRVHFVGGRLDVPDWLSASDLYFHPAYSESAGMILLEAMAAGLPVLTTDTCGYAFHVEKAAAGIVLASPFDAEVCRQKLGEMLTSKQRGNWRANGLVYAAKEDLYSCHERAADLIEQAIRGRAN
jgi:UDP-glucose:(heptosyl)LPS alpha-1,3-glucosyltransferase